MVVRPGVAGSTRWPVSAKNRALISSDLPRENSATKASTRRSEPRRWRTDAANACAGASSSLLSSSSRLIWSMLRSSARRQAASESRLESRVGVMARTQKIEES